MIRWSRLIKTNLDSWKIEYLMKLNSKWYVLYSSYNLTFNYFSNFNTCNHLLLQFQTIMENLFQTFDSMVSVANFGELSSCVFGWVEEHCKPQV